MKSKIKKIIYKLFTKLGLIIYTKKQKRILNKLIIKVKMNLLFFLLLISVHQIFLMKY